MQNMTITPDLQTRESVMVAAGRAQFGVRDQDGNVCYVKIECKRKLAGSGYERGTVALDEATHVFISEKGYGTPRLGTYYPPKAGYATGRFFEDNAQPGSDHMAALDAVVAVVNGERYDDVLDVRVESACGLCGHKLEDPVSVERGIGPDCAGTPTGSKILHASKFADTEAPAPVAGGGDFTRSYRPPLGEQQALTPMPANPAASNNVIALIRNADDAVLESIIQVARREQEKREFAKREAAQESQAALAGMD